MKIKKFYGIDGATKATGTTVIIDIFRASTVAAYLLDKNVKYIIPVSTKEEALALKKENPKYILVGEENGYKISGFDIGNSPFEIIKKNLTGKVVVHRSSRGTQGIVNAKNSSEIILGSFVTAETVITYLLKKKPSHISIVAMDEQGSEDDIFANYLINKLQGKKEKNMNTIINLLKTHPGAARFLNPSLPEFPEEDFYLCLDLNRFNFLASAIQNNDKLIIRKLKV